MLRVNQKWIPSLILIFLTTACSTPTIAPAASTGKSPKAHESGSGARAKYGPQATRLYHSQEYVRRHPAPDFWALIPYYISQQNGSSCSVASVTMVVNAARADRNLTVSDDLVTQHGLLEKVKNRAWSRAVGKGGKGVTLDELGALVAQSLKAFGFNGARVEIVHMDDTSAEARRRLRDSLSRNERSAKDFMILNFLQSEYTGDPEGAVGHISPVAAYDEMNRRVLVLDPDRQYYEPYWVSEEVLLKGMATRDEASGKPRGYVYVKVDAE